jgi:hypothetical protein
MEKLGNQCWILVGRITRIIDDEMEREREGVRMIE